MVCGTRTRRVRRSRRVWYRRTAAREPLTDVLAVPQSLAQAKTVLFGNEARGLTQDVLERVDRIVSIPIYGKAESLNLGTSAAVMLLSFGYVESC